jgi:6-pyruvoyltetrahydropterin/6-carboxytetrahydropterin synthase
MFRIWKQFKFSASHQLEGLPKDHQCSRLHGHNYLVELELAGPLNGIGFVRDFGELKEFKAIIDDVLDHRHLNDIVPFNPTAEALAEWLLLAAQVVYPEAVAVRVRETDTSWAEFRAAE